METEKNIKSMNRKYLVAYMLLNCIVFLALSDSVPDGLQRLANLNKKASNLLGLLLFPLSVVLEGILPSELKHKLVFWRIRNPLPGCRVFSEIAPKDPRIDMTRLKSYFTDDLPQDPERQNEIWYGLYNKYSPRSRVFHAHRAFLLTRDLAALSLICMPLSVMAYLLRGIGTDQIVIHLGFLISVLLFASVACQGYGNRFAANVLVEAIHDRG